MELYILSKQDLSILSICKLADYQINLDEETNAKSTFTLMKTNGLKKGNYMTLNGLYRQFIFVIDDVQTEKGSNVVTVTALDISNIFDRKVIEKNIDTMKSKSIEEFLANTISEDFVNSDDTALNVNYIEIYWHTNTQGNVATNAENGLYNFHTFLINCRQYKNIYTDFKLENLGNPQTVEGKRISVEAKNRKIVDISLHGESTQNGTPTPDNLVEIENIEGNIEFKVEGKNLYNVSDTNAMTEGITVDNEGWITVTGDNTDGTATKFFNYYTNNLNLKTGTNYNVIAEVKNVSGTGNASFVSVTSLSQQFKTNFYRNFSVLANNTIYNSINETSDEFLGNKGLRTFISFSSGESGSITFRLSVLEDTTITAENFEYEEYKSQVATFPLGEEKLMEGSYLADDGIHHRRKQVVLDGSESSWRENGVTKGLFQVTLSNVYVNNNTINAMSNLLVGNTGTNIVQANSYVDNSVATFSNNRLFFRINTYANNLNGLKSWLSSNSLTVEYELAEEEIVAYTEEQQEAWNKIKNITLFEGVNHISSEANMVLKYYPLKTVGLKFVLRIDIENKQETTELIDTTLSEVTDYNKIYEEDVTAKVQVYIREDGSEYNLYLKTDRTTTTNKDDPDRASGKIEVISVETADKAEEEALNVMKGNNYKHLVEFKITKTSKLMDITKLHIRKTYKNQNRRRYI